jgi:hypothetical protein
LSIGAFSAPVTFTASGLDLGVAGSASVSASSVTYQ